MTAALIGKVLACVALLIAVLWAISGLIERFAPLGYEDRNGFHNGRRPVRMIEPDEGGEYLAGYGVGSDRRWQ